MNEENEKTPIFGPENSKFSESAGPCPSWSPRRPGRVNSICGLETSLDSRPRVRQFLETRIFAQRIKHWIQPEQRRSERRVCGQGRLQLVSVIGVADRLSDGEGVVSRFFLIKYQIIVAMRREISFARQFCRVSLTNRTEINFAPQFFGITLFIIAVQQNFRDRLAKCSEANPERVSVADSKCAICHVEPYFGTEAATSF